MSEIAICIHKSAELHERPHNSDVHLDGAPGAEDARQHGNALLGKGVGAIASAAMLP